MRAEFYRKMCTVRCVIILASLLSWLRIAAAYNFPLTSIDARTSNYLRQEEEVWQNFPRKNLSDSLKVIYESHSFNLDFNVGMLDQIWPYDDQMAQNITELNRTASIVLSLVKNQQRWELQNMADNIIREVPRKLTAIYAEVQSPRFQKYFSKNSDPCQSLTHWDHHYAQLEGFTQNVAVDVYKTILEALAKGYMVSQLSYMMLVANAEVKYKKESQTLRSTFTANYRSFETETTRILGEEKNIIWNCDNYKANDSYTQITNLWQGYIDNEANISPDGSCTGQCDDFTYTRQHRCLNDTLCAPNYLDRNKTSCHGEIRDCSFVESDMWICPNENDNQPGKRYDYIRYGSGKVLGKPKFCPHEIKLKSWNRWFVECSYCLCYCDTTSNNTDRYFSLRPALSNITDNRVVTGIQFIKRNHIIHLAISERHLRANGGVYPAERSSTTWKSDFNFQINDTDVVEGIDYHRISVRNAAIDLDILEAPPGHLVTGVRLRLNEGHIRFELRVTPFNYETGLLDKRQTRPIWIGNNNVKHRIFEQSPDVPTRTPRPSMRNRDSDTYIEFGYSDLNKDISQTTVPFIETLPVEARIPTILSGAGLYYKTQPGFGGFIAPLVLTYNANGNGDRQPQYQYS